MRKLNAPKAQYVDLSYGWQSRGEATRRSRRRRWALIVVDSDALPILVYLCWQFT